MEEHKLETRCLITRNKAKANPALLRANFCIWMQSRGIMVVVGVRHYREGTSSQNLESSESEDVIMNRYGYSPSSTNPLLAEQRLNPLGSTFSTRIWPSLFVRHIEILPVSKRTSWTFQNHPIRFQTRKIPSLTALPSLAGWLLPFPFLVPGHPQ